MKSLAAFSFLVLAGTSCRAANVPGAIPRGYEATPHGLVHRSCIHAVPLGHRVEADGTLSDRSGNRRRFPPCRHPRLDPRAFQNFGNNPPQVTGWVASAGWTDTVPLSFVGATFVVPAAPADTGALVYFFPAMTPWPDTAGIVQPVLQYGYAPASNSGGNYWTLISWYCCPDSSSWYSTPINVSAGDTIVGTMSVECTNGVCNGTVTGVDVTAGDSTVLTWTRTVSPFVNIAGGVVEAHGVNECSQFPASPITFTNITVMNQAGQIVQPVWRDSLHGQLPNCGYAVQSTPTSVTLSY